MLEKLGIFSGLPKGISPAWKRLRGKFRLERDRSSFPRGTERRASMPLWMAPFASTGPPPAEEEVTLEIAGPGCTFAEASLFSDIYHCYCVALKDSKICMIRKDDFLEMIRGTSGLPRPGSMSCPLKSSASGSASKNFPSNPPKARIASYPLLLAEVQKSTSISLPAHRKSIATLLGMTHETFYRMAKELEKKDIVRFEKQRADIRNRLQLEKLVD